MDEQLRQLADRGRRHQQRRQHAHARFRRGFGRWHYHYWCYRKWFRRIDGEQRRKWRRDTCGGEYVQRRHHDYRWRLGFFERRHLGSTANAVTLGGSGSPATLKAFGGTLANPLSITTQRTVNFSDTTAANNVIDVAANTTLELDSSFGANSNGFTKTDLGTLILAADNSAWTGALSISLGAVRVTNSAALGSASGPVTVGNSAVPNGIGAALQLANVSISDPLTLNYSGINNAGSLEAYSGVNSVSGLITLASAVTIGADAGATLNILGGISGTQALTFSGGGRDQYHDDCSGSGFQHYQAQCRDDDARRQLHGLHRGVDD